MNAMIARFFLCIFVSALAFALIDLVPENWILHALRPAAAAWRWWQSIPCIGDRDAQ